MCTDQSDIRYTYNARGGLATLTTLEQLGVTISPEVTRYGYDVGGALSRIESPNGVTAEHRFDAMGRPTDVRHAGPAGPLDSFTYLRDAAGRVVTVANGLSPDAAAALLAGGAAGGLDRVAYAYDALGRLTSEEHYAAGAAAPARRIASAYDAAGNRVSVSRAAGGAAEVTRATFDARDRLLGEVAGGVATAYEYDANGSLTRRRGPAGDDRYAYDVRGRLSALSAERAEGGGLVRIDESYRYDDRGTRTRRSTTTTRGGVAVPEVTWFVTDARSPYGHSRVVEERTTPGGVAVASFVHGPVPVSLRRAGGAGFYLSDAHSGVRGLADAAGVATDAYLFDASGTLLERTGATANPLLYRGEQFDAALGQYHLRARQYDPASGRFTATDPLVGVPGGPATLHDYAYAWNDPVQVTDPTGMFGIGIGSFMAVAASLTTSVGYYNSSKRPIGVHIANIVRQSMEINYIVSYLEEWQFVGSHMAKAAQYKRYLVRMLYKNAPEFSQNIRDKVRDAMTVIAGGAIGSYLDGGYGGAAATKSQLSIPIKLNGFPNFTGYLYTTGLLRPSTSVVFILLRGKRGLDDTASDRRRSYDTLLAGSKKPAGTTWHHHEVVGIMMLVDSRTHPGAISRGMGGLDHTGGALYWSIAMNQPYGEKNSVGLEQSVSGVTR